MKTNSAAASGNPASYPDRRIVLVYFAASMGFGLLMGVVFPVYAGFFVDFKSPVHQSIFVAGCVAAGLMVGGMSFLIGQVTVLRVIRLIEARLTELCANDGDLSRDIELWSSDCIGRLVRQFNLFQGKLRVMVGQIRDVSHQIQKVSVTLSAASEQSAASIEEMAATSAQVARFAGLQTEQTVKSAESVKTVLEGITRSDELTQGMATQFFVFTQSMEANRRGISSVTAEAKTTDELAQRLQATGESGQHVLDDLRRAIAAVAGQADEIQEIVKIILDIAAQTNLLSMNAAIEAAHAGNAGRGFSVVAEEIRKLAQTSSTQGQTIKRLLDAVGRAVAQTLAQSEATRLRFLDLTGDIALVHESGQNISQQMSRQEAADAALSDGLGEFGRFYAQLAEAMDQQIQESEVVKTGLVSVEDASRQISQSMAEQSLGMQQAAEAVVQVRETTLQLRGIIDELTEQTRQFKLAAD